MRFCVHIKSLFFPWIEPNCQLDQTKFSVGVNFIHSTYVTFFQEGEVSDQGFP